MWNIPLLSSLRGLGWHWEFERAVPHFGNIFYFDNPTQEGLQLHEHAARTQTWFDIDSVRFIHLPAPSEELSGHYLETGQTTINWLWHQFKSGAASYFLDTAWQDFERDVHLAEEAKWRGEIDFIVVYGHTPLITSPNYNLHHTGIFNFLRAHEQGKKWPPKEIESAPDYGPKKLSYAQNLERIFKNYSIDGYFCGHNHLYDHSDWEVWPGVSIPMVTIGIGTSLHSAHREDSADHQIQFPGFTPRRPAVTPKQFIAAHDGAGPEFIGFVRCDVDPVRKSMRCVLHGSDPDYAGFVGTEIDDQMQPRSDGDKDNGIFDDFTLRARPGELTVVDRMLRQLAEADRFLEQSIAEGQSDIREFGLGGKARSFASRAQRHVQKSLVFSLSYLFGRILEGGKFYCRKGDPPAVLAFEAERAQDLVKNVQQRLGEIRGWLLRRILPRQEFARELTAVNRNLLLAFENNASATANAHITLQAVELIEEDDITMVYNRPLPQAFLEGAAFANRAGIMLGFGLPTADVEEEPEEIEPVFMLRGEAAQSEYSD